MTVEDTKARSKGRAASKAMKQPAMPLLPTSVVGSYSVPEWLERLKTDFYQRRISGAYLDEIHDVAIKAALKDQERAGLDVVSDGELRRDNDIDYFLARLPGLEITQRAKAYYFDYYDAVLQRPIPVIESEEAPMGLLKDFLFTREFTDRPVKFSLTGPFSLSHKVRNEFYDTDEELVMALARVLNREARALAQAGVSVLQVDEPFLAGYPEQAELAAKALNAVFEGVERGAVTRAVHVCYGNRYARPLWEGHYDFLFPAMLEVDVDQLVLEFARKGYDDVSLFKRYDAPNLTLGLGVIDVKRQEVETPDVVASRIRRALEVVPPERLVVNPDCGLRHLPADIARAKLHALTDGTAIVRKDLTGTS